MTANEQQNTAERKTIKPLFGLTHGYALLSIVVTTTMDFTGFILFSALPLIIWVVAYRYHSGISFRDLGLSRHVNMKSLVIGVLYPLLVMGSLIAIMIGVQEIQIQRLTALDWPSLAAEIALIAVASLLLVIITEEAFFRGVLWQGLLRSGVSQSNTLLLSSIIFSAWHISLVVSFTEFRLEGLTRWVYLINAVFMGLNWGILRRGQKSIWASAVSHTVWNAMAYTIFGFGITVAAFDYNATMYNVETGIVGLMVNIVAFVVISRTLPVKTEISLIEVKPEQIPLYSDHFAELDEFRAIVLRYVETGRGQLWVNNPDAPNLLIYRVKMIRVVISQDPLKVDRIDEIARLLTGNGILIANNQSTYEVLRSAMSGRIIARPGERTIFTPVENDIIQSVTIPGYTLRILQPHDLEELKKFKSYFNMVDSLEEMIDTGLLYGSFDGDNLAGVIGPAHVPFNGQFEVQLVVSKEHRRKGLATWLSTTLLSDSIQQGLHPIWDADNEKSAGMCRNLGFTERKKYELLFVTNVWLKLIFMARLHIIIQATVSGFMRLKRRFF
jgi:membrane protease YdiL (CAAX protease family)